MRVVAFLILHHCPCVLLQLLAPPTRPADLWHPFGLPSTPRPKDQRIAADEAVVRLTIGDVLGHRVVLPSLPWNANQDPSEQLPPDRRHAEPNPLPLLNNVTVFTFLGVPYAEPPTGERRFKPPQQLIHLPGDGPFLAFKYAPACAQDPELRPSFFVRDPYPHLVNEDCLYLNIFTPDISKSSGLAYPVIVFLHGGNFQTGTAADWPGHGLASRGIVVVTVNYRLGTFGFMSLGDAQTGNYGLKDQRLAMEWVRDHIASFGGDPQAVTLVGHDAGGASVGFHMLSPLSRSLFRAASSMSGAEVSYHSLIGKPALAFNNTISLGRYLGCVDALPSNVWSCILTRSTDDIVRGTFNVPIQYNRYLFMPTLDGYEIPANPLWMLNNIPTGGASYASPVPFLCGINAQDGSEVVLEDRYLGQFNDFNRVDHEFMRDFVLEYAFRHNYTTNREAISEAIIDRYTYWPDRANDWEIREQFVQLATDAYYTAPVLLSAHLHSAAGSRTFVYVNNYNISRGNDAVRFIPSWMSVCHECDLYLLFNYPHLPPELRPYHLRDVNFTDVDRNASLLFSNIFRRFALTQNPNFHFDGSWAAHEPRAHWYMNFNYSHWSEMEIPGKIDRDYRFRDVAFWNEYLPALVNYMTTTFAPEELAVRRELIVFKWVVAALIISLMLFIILAGSFAYQVFERGQRPAEKERTALVEYVDFPSQSTVEMHPRTHRQPPPQSRISSL